MTRADILAADDRGDDTALLPFSAPEDLAPTRTVLLTADPAAADPEAAKREELRAYFHRTCEIDDRL
ncbi:MAG: hypothetical protein ACKO3G_15750, partial [Planctomycetaceae bacterium]